LQEGGHLSAVARFDMGARHLQHDLQALVPALIEFRERARTIAGCVENDSIRERLREIGVDFARGCGIDRPRLLDELPDQACGLPA